MITRMTPEQMTAETFSRQVLWLPEGESRNFDWCNTDGGTNRNPSGVKVTPETSLKATVVLACVRTLAESVAALKFGLFRRNSKNTKKPDLKNPIDRLISIAPNSWQTSFEWREQMMLHLGLWGNAYSLIKRGKGNVVKELIPLHPSRMTVEEVNAGVLRYTYSEGGQYGAGDVTTYAADSIMHIRWMSDDGINGMVPTEISKDAIALARACEIHGSTYFGNGARPGVILETENAITPEAALSLREGWERVHRGVDKSWKTAVLTNGLKAHELGSNNQESQFLEVRRFQTEEICRIYRVPPHLVMDLNRATFSNIEQQSLDFLQYTLTPWLKRIEQVIDRDVIGEDSVFSEFDTKTFLRGDAASRAAFYTSLWNMGVLSINEIREAESLNPVDGGDQRFVQLNMAPLIQEKPVEEVKPEDDSASTTPMPATASTGEEEQPLAQTAFTGIQVEKLITLSQQVALGSIDREAAIEIILQAFPTIDRAEAERILPMGFEPDNQDENIVGDELNQSPSELTPVE